MVDQHNLHNLHKPKQLPSTLRVVEETRSQTPPPPFPSETQAPQAEEKEKVGRENTNPNPDHPRDPTPRRLQHRLDIATTQGRLLRHGPLDQLALLIGGDLARDPDLRGGAYRLRVGPCRYNDDSLVSGGPA